MAAMTFACPGCGAVLKSPIAVAAGKNIKCPQCGTAFATGEAQEDFSPEVEADAPVPVGYDDPAARNGHGPATREEQWIEAVSR